VTEGFPGHNLPAKPLQDVVIDSSGKLSKLQVTHPSDLLGVIPWPNPENLGCDLLALELTLPHVREPPVGNWVLRWVVTKWDLQ
jgi:hypothetical protein